MSAAEHDRHRDDVGAYLLGALPDDELRAFEAHLETCHVCRDELEQLGPAVHMLPRSVPQFEPPPSLKAALMETVEAEARRARGKSARRGWLPRLERPRMAWGIAAVVLALAVAAGFGVAQLGSHDNAGRTLAATVDQTRLGKATASLTLDDGGKDGGVLHVTSAPRPGRGQTYQAWIARGKAITPAPTFGVGADGDGAVALPASLEGVDAVLVTREPTGGSTIPSETPVMRVDL
jgi:anti-sigma-K factor RskA